MTKQAQSWKRVLVRHATLYAIDMAIATGGFIYGFGLEVKNWWALLGLMLVTRFCFHAIQSAYYLHEAKQEATSEEIERLRTALQPLTDSNRIRDICTQDIYNARKALGLNPYGES